MLPEFLKTKEKIEKMFNFILREAVLAQLGPIREVPVTFHFEGSKNIIIYPDGSATELRSKEISVMLEFEMSEIETITHQQVIEKIIKLAIDMAGQQKKFFYERIAEISEESDSVVSAEGRPFSMDLFFEVLEKIDVDFDENGNPTGITVAMSPELYHSASKVFEQAKNDPEMDKKFDIIMNKKRTEWNVRESNRKLVG